MRSTIQKYKRQSILLKTQRNLAVLLRTRFETLRRSKIQTNLKIEDDAMNRRRRRFCICLKIYHIYQGQLRQCVGKC
jgi:hypothetical protein